MSWRIRGSYFESCNCDDLSLPPDRRGAGRTLDPRDLLGRPLVADRGGSRRRNRPLRYSRRPGLRYSDDEPGSPWTWVLYLDARAAEEQRAALEGIFTGRLGGDAESHFPWAWKASELVAVRPVEIDVDHTRRRQWLRIRNHVSVRIHDRYSGGETVTCVIPGHERAGEELVVDDGRLAFSYRGVCGYGSRFDYAG